MSPSKQASWPSDETTFPRRFGPYVLVTYLGEGGMGRVYLALERIHTGDRLVVIKRFGNPHSRFTPEQIRENQERFAREAQISSSLDHPCIARTLHFVPQGTDSYLVQEFIHGMTVEYLAGSLADEDARIPTPLALHIVTEIARALAYLHDFRNLGLVHRDLTSANVMVSRAGDVKVIDFGIAKATLADDDSLTRPNVLIGKPMWTAPEVLAGAKPDRRADIYALGLIAWQLLTGRDPAEQLASGHSLPLPSSFNAAIGAEYDRLVVRAVEPRPEARFQTAREFLAQLDLLLPADFDGPGKLGQLLHTRERFGQKEFFDESVERARALFLDAPSTTTAVPTKRRWLIPTGAALLGLIGIGVFALVRGGSGQPAIISPPPSMPPPTRPPSPAELPDTSAPAATLEPSLPPDNTPVSPPPPSTPPSRTPAVSPSPRHAKPIGHGPEREPEPAPAVRKTPQDLLDEALDAYSAADTEAALRLARASIAERPSAEAYVLIGRILKKSNPAAAGAALEKALKLEPANLQAKRLWEALGSPPQ